jgi:hypothetical protein
MFWTLNVEPLVVRAMSRWDDKAREDALNELHRKRRRAVPALIEMLKSSIFNADKYFNYCQAAAQILLALAKIDRETHDLIVNRLLESISGRGFQVAPSEILAALGHDASRS